MVSIVRRKVGKKEYQFLHHTYRLNGKINSIDMRLDENSDIEKLKEQFILKIIDKRWSFELKNIKNNLGLNRNKLPIEVLLKDLHQFGVEFTYSTNKIEGSTLSARDVSNIIDHSISPTNKNTDDIIETKSHMNVYEKMLEYKADIDLIQILNWHDIIFNLTKPGIAGIYREWEVSISGSHHVPPPASKVLELMENLISWYNNKKQSMEPVLLACLFHLQFIDIHPFGDGNGRLGRLLMNFILQKNDFPMFIITPKMKSGYFKAIERSLTKKDEVIFVNWFFTKYITVQ